MARRRRGETEEQRARRTLISELLSAVNVHNMDNIQELFKETIVLNLVTQVQHKRISKNGLCSELLLDLHFFLISFLTLLLFCLKRKCYCRGKSKVDLSFLKNHKQKVEKTHRYAVIR